MGKGGLLVEFPVKGKRSLRGFIDQNGKEG